MCPYLFIFNKNISTYGLLYLLAVLVVFLLAKKKSNRYNILFDDLLVIGGFILLFGFLGSTILFAVVTFSVVEIINSLLQFDFHVFQGLVFYGGLIGGIIGAVVGIKVARVELFDAERCIVPFLPLGHAIGRIGCLMAGCCYAMEYDGWCAIYYKSSLSNLSSEQGYFPIQPLECIFNIIIMVVLIFATKKVKQKYNLLFLYLTLYSMVRFVLEYFRGDEVRGFYLNFSSSQWISIILLVISIIGYCLNCYSNKKSAINNS